MTEHNRNRALHRYHDACPRCYGRGVRRRSGKTGKLRFYCICGTVWRWSKGSLRAPVICT